MIKDYFCKIENESISFDELRQKDDIDKETFSNYITEIYQDLAETGEKCNKGIHFNRFSDLIPECPVFLASKFFNSLLTKENKSKSYLSTNEFLSVLIVLKFGTYEEVLRLIFNIFDFDRDGFIKAEDVKLVISFLPLKLNNPNPEYLYQMESLNELDKVIIDTFLNSEISTFSDFIKYTDRKANIFLLVFCYLYSTIPMLDKDFQFIIP